MADELRILGIAGSLRTGSYNRGLIRAASALLPHDAYMDVYEDLGEIPRTTETLKRKGTPSRYAD